MFDFLVKFLVKILIKFQIGLLFMSQTQGLLRVN